MVHALIVIGLCAIGVFLGLMCFGLLFAMTNFIRR